MVAGRSCGRSIPALRSRSVTQPALRSLSVTQRSWYNAQLGATFYTYWRREGEDGGESEGEDNLAHEDGDTLGESETVLVALDLDVGCLHPGVGVHLGAVTWEVSLDWRLGGNTSLASHKDKNSNLGIENMCATTKTTGAAPMMKMNLRSSKYANNMNVDCAGSNHGSCNVGVNLNGMGMPSEGISQRRGLRDITNQTNPIKQQ